MLNNTGFDLWADGYDKSVGLSDENDRYPFAGYRAMMNALYQRVLAQSGRDVLDIGFGTGVLTSRLYKQGCRIYGQDFSARMIELAQAKMPGRAALSGRFFQRPCARASCAAVRRHRRDLLAPPPDGRAENRLSSRASAAFEAGRLSFHRRRRLPHARRARSVSNCGRRGLGLR